MSSAPPMPAVYRRACGPQALAAVLGLGAHAAARLLWSAGHENGRRPRDPGRTSNLYDIVGLIVRAGRPCQEWSTEVPGAQILDAMGVMSELRRFEEHDPRAPWERCDTEIRDAVREAVLAERARLAEEVRVAPPRPAGSTPELHTVRSWQRTFPVGTWLLATFPPEPGLPDHVLALRDGELIAGGGDGRYAGRALFTAYKILPTLRRRTT